MAVIPAALSVFISAGATKALAQEIEWSGYTWHVRSGMGGPGPNAWTPNNVWIDGYGRLHLKIAHGASGWTCAEVWTDKRLGFGKYEFDVDSPAETLDDSIVLGLFNYPPRDVGPDGTNEIDIEFATWGGVQKMHGNWSVWPVKPSPSHGTHVFGFPIGGDGESVNAFDWTSKSVGYGWMRPVPRGVSVRHSWTYAPDAAAVHIPQNPMPVHMNLWLFNGKPPTDDKELEIVISAFKFTPGKGK